MPNVAKYDGAGGGGVTGPATSTDNALVRWSGTAGATVKDTGITVADNNNVTIPGAVAINGDTDEVQLIVKANATQNVSIFSVRTNAGVDKLTIDTAGTMDTILLRANELRTQASGALDVRIGSNVWTDSGNGDIYRNGGNRLVIGSELSDAGAATKAAVRVASAVAYTTGKIFEVGDTGEATFRPFLTVTPNSLEVTGGFAAGGVTAVKTAAYTALKTDSLVLADTAAVGAWTLTLPAANAAKGQVLRVKLTATSANLLTVARAGTDTITTIAAAAATSFTLNPATTYPTCELISDGTSVWYMTSLNT